MNRAFITYRVCNVFRATSRTRLTYPVENVCYLPFAVRATPTDQPAVLLRLTANRYLGHPWVDLELPPQCVPCTLFAQPAKSI